MKKGNTELKINKLTGSYEIIYLTDCAGFEDVSITFAQKEGDLDQYFNGRPL